MIYPQSNLPDTVYIHPMEYDQRRKSAPDMQCMYVGLAAIAIVYLLMQQNRMPRGGIMFPLVNGVQGVSSMLAKGVRAMVVGTPGLPDAALSHNAIKAGTVSAITSDDKQENKRLLKSVIKRNDVILIVYAPWCPHCKTVIHDIATRSHSGLLKSDMTYILCNGDACDGSCFSGPDRLLSLEYYPSFFTTDKHGQLKIMSSVDEAEKSKYTDTENELENETENETEKETDTTGDGENSELFSALF